MANCTNWNVWYWPARYKPSGSSVGKAPESRSIKVHQGGSASKPTQVRFPVVTKKSLLPSKRQNGKWGYGNRCKNQLNTILCIFLHIMGLLYQTVTHLADKTGFQFLESNNEEKMTNLKVQFFYCSEKMKACQALIAFTARVSRTKNRYCQMTLFDFCLW